MTPDPSCPPGPINVMVQPDNFWNNSKPKTEQDSVKPSQGQTPPPHSPLISGLLFLCHSQVIVIVLALHRYQLQWAGEAHIFPIV